MSRTSEHAGMLIFVEGEVGCLAGTRKVIETTAMMLSTFEYRLRAHITIAIRIQNASCTECVGEGLNVVIAEPLLVEGKLSLATSHDLVSFMSCLST